MKKIKYLVTIIAITIIITLGVTITTSNANTQQTMSENEIRNYIETQYSMNTDSLDFQGLVDLYNNLSTQYTNEEIANMIESNKQEIIDSGVSENVITTGTQILKTTDTEELKNIINNDLDVTKIQTMLDNGYSPAEVINNIATPLQSIALAITLLLANTFVKAILLIVLILLCFNIIIRWAIFKKAGEHGWASIIPLYRDIVYYRVCGISPWVLLLLLIPVVGWFILLIIDIVSRFNLAKAFGRGVLFGFGLWFFGVIFETIIACSKNIKYIGFDGNNE